MRRWPQIAMLALAAWLTAERAPAAEDAILGTWLTENGDSKVAISSRRADDGGTLYSGEVVWLANPTRNGQPVHDANASDPALRARPILGLEVLSGFTRSPDGVLRGGTLYSPRRGKSYPAELSLTPDGRLSVVVKAGLLSKTVYWTR